MKKLSDHQWTAVSEPFGSAVMTLSQADFVSRYSGHYLCVLMGETGREDTPEFGTLGGGSLPVAGQQELQVFPLIKRQANPFSMMITFGRAPNNDLHMELGQVSKFHGYFSRAGEGWQLTDAGSTNGTFLNGTRLPHRTVTKIEPGSELMLGAVPAWFVDAAGLFDLLLKKEIAAS